MDDKRLDQLLDHAAKHWRVPGDPPLDDIWKAVAAEAFDLPGRRRRPGWTTVGIAAAAALMVGVLGGRYSAHPAAVVVANGATAAIPTAPAVTSDPDHRAMGELLGRTAVLLAALPRDRTNSATDPQITQEGARLLTTTRMLLDSPVGSDTRLRSLLQDLEMVLAQVARFDPKHRTNEIQFIQSALDEHDIVPRLRSAAADLSLDDF